MTTYEDIKRKKARQAKLSYASSGLGLTGGALVGAGAILKKPKVAQKAAKGMATVLRRPDLSTAASRAKFAEKLTERGYAAGATGGAIGGIGGLNFASIQRDESNMRKPRASKPMDGAIKKPRV